MSVTPIDSLRQISTALKVNPSEPLPPLGKNPKVLMVWPKFPPSFWGFEGVLEMLPEKAVSPPLGLITIAAMCPAAWEIRLLDRAFEELRDEDLLWADLVMVSAMHAQTADTVSVLARARKLGRRTFIGGPWASSEPELLAQHSDHVLAGEAEEVFAQIATELGEGTAQRLYRVLEKPDMTLSPVPRFDLLVLLCVLGERLLDVGVADRDPAVDLLQLRAGDEILAHQSELILDFGIVLQPGLHTFIGEQTHAQVIVGKLLLAGALGVALVFGGKGLERRLEL